MKIFVDTGFIDKLEQAVQLGVIDGATTNPTWIKLSGKTIKEIILGFRKVLPEGDISAQVLSTTVDGMVQEAYNYLKWDENLTIKIPMTSEGLNAVRILSSKGIKTNVTLIFTLLQAMIAAKAGATYVSPFISRLDDIGISGLELVRNIRELFDKYQFKTQLLSASIRNIEQIKQCALIGSDICTIPPELVGQMIKNPLTDSGLVQFLNDSLSIPNK